MRTLVITTFLTLDGVMQSPGGPEEDPSSDCTHGGWLVPHADAEMGGRWSSGSPAPRTSSSAEGPTRSRDRAQGA